MKRKNTIVGYLKLLKWSNMEASNRMFAATLFYHHSKGIITGEHTWLNPHNYSISGTAALSALAVFHITIKRKKCPVPSPKHYCMYSGPKKYLDSEAMLRNL